MSSFSNHRSFDEEKDRHEEIHLFPFFSEERKGSPHHRRVSFFSFPDRKRNGRKSATRLWVFLGSADRAEGPSIGPKEDGEPEAGASTIGSPCPALISLSWTASLCPFSSSLNSRQICLDERPPLTAAGTIERGGEH